MPPLCRMMGLVTDEYSWIILTQNDLAEPCI